ncbi:MAG: hypothetical protein JO072_09015 [Parafilimonas sp.]|nr:hypothetical protein [Parafilimonas sp.]
MIQVGAKPLQEQLKQLKRKRDIANEAFLDALTYVKPFEEVKKLFYDLKAIEAELKELNAKVQASA